MVQSVAEAQDLVAFVAELCERIQGQIERLSQDPLRAEEQSWLSSARSRLQAELHHVQQGFARAALLPEFETERKAKLLGLEQAWVDSLEGLLAGLTRRVGAGNPLVEVLFPHQKFEKLRRSSQRMQSYMADFERRRNSTYVTRMCADPEYPFLNGLLAEVARAKANWQQELAATPPPTEEQEALRAELLTQATQLSNVLRQARALAEAALTFEPEHWAALAAEYKSRRRIAR
ncbi:MAG TPA: hypothetical protein VFQ61_30070 [Polyangiaceae bacterium]|nr:hypothetical protein [Polyangiaceae bacterium]